MPLLVVQMGHAGRTSGATGAPGEQAFAAAVGASCARLLTRDGWRVRLIVADPPAAQYQGDAFVAVHADGSTNPVVRGASVGYQNSSGDQLATAWRAAYVAEGFTGPWHPANYTANLAQYYGVRAAINQGNTRACIIECGTITNAEDRALMLPDRVARAIGTALNIPMEGGIAVDGMTQAQNDALARVWTILDSGGAGPNQFNRDLASVVDQVKVAVADAIAAVLDRVDDLEAKIDGLIGSGVVLRSAGEITVRAEKP